MKWIFLILLFSLTHINASCAQEPSSLCNKPLHAPASEQHLNCYELCWLETVPFGARLLYALSGGQKVRRKHGYWKEYSSEQKLINEGEYKRGKKRGVFKYFKSDGTVERTETEADRKNLQS